MDRALKITNVHIFQYDLPFTKSFSIHNTSLGRREGLLVYVTGADGKTGIGEIAPLPGLSREPLKKSLYQTKTLRTKLIGCTVPDSLKELKAFLSGELFGDSVASVHCGIEAAFIYLIAQRQNKIPAQILDAGDIKDVKTAALLQGTLPEVKAAAERFYEEGYRVFKLKVGSKNIPLDVKKTDEVREIIGPKSRLRLDANAGWSLKEAVAFGELVGTEGIQFIEDPVRELDAVENFYKKTRLPVALDELLSGVGPEQFEFPDGARFCVLKPMVAGGIFKTLQWIAKAKDERRKVVISSAFESGIGLTMLANLALLTEEAAGLGTGSWFKDDILKVPVVQKGGNILKKSLQFDVSDIKIEHLTLIE